MFHYSEHLSFQEMHLHANYKEPGKLRLSVLFFYCPAFATCVIVCLNHMGLVPRFRGIFGVKIKIINYD